MINTQLSLRFARTRVQWLNDGRKGFLITRLTRFYLRPIPCFQTYEAGCEMTVVGICVRNAAYEIVLFPSGSALLSNKWKWSMRCLATNEVVRVMLEGCVDACFENFDGVRFRGSGACWSARALAEYYRWGLIGGASGWLVCAYDKNFCG